MWTPFPFLYVSQGGAPADTRATSTTALGTSNASVTYGTSVTFTATITTTGTPTGTVTFYDGGSSIGTGAVSGGAGTGTATFATSTLAVGSHSITAIYGGDATHQPSGSSALTQTITAITSTTAVTGVPASPTTSGTGVVFTGTVTATGSPTGTIRFQDGGVDMTGFTNPVTMSGNTASTPSITTLSTATHTITGIYSGDATHSGSTSAGYSHQVTSGGADTTTGLVSYWPFSEGSGTTVADSQATQNAVATLGSSGGWVAPGFRCNGVDTYATALDNAAYNPGTAFTVFTWIFAPNGVGGFILSQFDNLASDRSWTIGTDTTTGQFLRIVLSNDGTNTNLKDYTETTIDLTLGGWRSVAFSWGPSSTLKIYVDGVNKTAGATKARDDTFTINSGALRNSATRICWGGLWAGGGLTNPYLVDVQRTRIYNVVKTDADIAAIHALGHA